MDIRKFFSPIGSKGSNKNDQKETSAHNKSTTKNNAKNHSTVLISSDEDVIECTPEKPKPTKSKSKKRKVQVISSDSEEEKYTKPCKDNITNTNKNHTIGKKLKPLTTLEDIFGKAPVKQTKIDNAVPKGSNDKQEVKTTKQKKDKSPISQSVPNTELGISGDPLFDKTLLDLDEDLFVKNLDVLDKTIDEALSNKNSEEIVNSSKSVDKGKAKASGDTVTPKRKRKTSETDSGIDPDQERYEKRRQSAVLYQKYLHRGGPKHHGSKEIPKGKADCLKNLSFIRTGVLDSLENDEFENLIKGHGGRVVHSISKKVNFVVVGDEPGPAKLEKAESYKIPMISEDELLDMIKIKSGMLSVNGSDEKIDKDKNDSDRKEYGIEKDIDHKSDKLCESLTKTQLEDVSHKNDELCKTKRSPSKIQNKHVSQKSPKKPTVEKDKVNTQPETKNKTESSSTNDNLVHNGLSSYKDNQHDSAEVKLSQDKPNQTAIAFTEKYKPMSTKAIIGQQTEKSNMQKLKSWLQDWYKNHGGKSKKAKFSYWSNSTDTTLFKCALLSGPPGVGKTTTATLVAKELGFDIVELNASDTRSKKLLQDEVSQLLSSQSLAGFATGEKKVSKNRVLIMDEVDGMAGNEDRGGVQELISLIKKTRVPIICICNDRNHMKMRALVHHCLDLRFSKPRLEQIRGAMMTVCFKEGLSIKPAVLTDIINSAGMDIRQTLNNLYVWSSMKQNLDSDKLKRDADKARKDVPLGPWEVVRQVFSAWGDENTSLADMFRLFFYDYSIGPLFVQENYVQVVPQVSKVEHMKKAALASECLSIGDVIATKIRSTNCWSLLETQGLFQSVLPGYHMKGRIEGQINFPSWLGKNSTKTKRRRLLAELESHARMSISGGREAMNLDYVQHLHKRILTPLIRGVDGISETVSIMKGYHFLREDLDSIEELAIWPNRKRLVPTINSHVKGTFTKTYNKEIGALPYSVTSAVSKKKSAAIVQNDYDENDEQEQQDSGAEDDITKDAMIKPKKKPSKSKTSGEEIKPGTSKPRGKGKGKKK